MRVFIGLAIYLVISFAHFMAAYASARMVLHILGPLDLWWPARVTICLALGGFVIYLMGQFVRQYGADNG